MSWGETFYTSTHSTTVYSKKRPRERRPLKQTEKKKTMTLKMVQKKGPPASTESKAAAGGMVVVVLKRNIHMQNLIQKNLHSCLTFLISKCGGLMLNF